MNNSENELDDLLKTQYGTHIASVAPEKLDYTKKEMSRICNDLSSETQKYDPKKTVKIINDYIATANKLDRILYSIISNYIFSLDMSSRGIFVTNLEKLLSYTLRDENKVAEDCQKIVIKIYDHSQLAIHQVENVNNIFGDSIDEARQNLQSQVKGIEREYISILGIFASIVLTFVGGITYSTSVLQNISSASIFRLLLVIDFLAFVLINTIYILVKFILTINEKDCNFFNIEAINIAISIIAILIILSWAIYFRQISNFFQSLP